MNPKDPTSRRDVARLAVLVLAGLATVAAGSPWLRAFGATALMPVVGVASVVALAVPAVVGWRWARSATVSTVVSLVAFVALSLVVVLRDPIGFASLGRGLLQGPTLILTDAVPIVQPRWALVVPFALTWLTGAAAGELLVRARTTVVAVVWLASFALATVGASGGAYPDGWWTLALAVSACATVMLRRWLVDTEHLDPALEGHAGLLRAVGLGAVSLVVVAVSSVVVVANLGHFSNRAVAVTRHPPVLASTDISPPLAFEEMRQATRSDPRNLFTVQVSHAVPGYLTSVDLDDYDGSTWVIPQSLEPDGGTVAAVDQQTGPESLVPVTQDYAVLRSPGVPWMPFVSRPSSVSGVGVRVDPTSGMVAPSAPLEAGMRYQVASYTQPVVEQDLSRADRTLPLGISDTPEDLEIPAGERAGLVQVLGQLATHLPTGSTRTLAFVAALADYFRTLPQVKVTGAYSADGADLGLSYGDLLRQVDDLRKATPEQFASLFTLLLRAEHDPARLATGYRLPGTLRPGRTYTVTSTDAWTWVEVPVQGLGWVVVDTSSAKSKKAAPLDQSSSGSTTTTTQPPQTNLTKEGSREFAPKVALHLPRPGGGVSWVLVVVVAVGLVACLLAMAPLAVRRRRRRRRRRGRAPDAQVLGAWHESLDVLWEVQGIETAAFTGEEVVAVAGERLGADASRAVHHVATLANEVVFSGRATVTGDEAAEAWRSEAQLAKLANRALGRADRLRAYLRLARTKR